MDTDLLKGLSQLSQVGTNVLLIGGIIFLWRAYQAQNAAYAALIEKCVTALVRVNDYLDSHEK